MKGETRIYRRTLNDGGHTYSVHYDNAPTARVVTTCRTCGRYCKQTCTFMLSHFGLCAIVVSYAIAGGYIFQALEAPNEERQRQNMKVLRDGYVKKLIDLYRCNNTDNDTISMQDNWTNAVEAVLDSFQRFVFNMSKKEGWDGSYKTSPGKNLKWSYPGSLLYAVTVITTIGYGHIAPRTDNGRLVTIIYALIGIPLTLLCLAKIGTLLGNCFRFTYRYTCRFLAWVFLPKRSKYRQKQRRVEENEEGLKIVRVPIVLSIAILVVYILGGAMMFSLWEDWGYLIGAYFCFITLSTVGFGDFVPGSDNESWHNQEKAIICALYLVFGLAVIAMCFNLMQEEVKAKFVWLGRKLGLIEQNKT